MRILILADPNSSHTFKWTTALLKKEIDVAIFSLTKYDRFIYEDFPSIGIKSLGLKRDYQSYDASAISKYVYLKAIPLLKKFIKEFKPDILHAHYASSYGLIGALIGFKPYLISVWGTDILHFPKESFLQSMLLKFSLFKADKILATGYYLAKETKVYTKKKIFITPFGVDTDIFKPKEVKRIFPTDSIVIGIIKRLEENYGVKDLIKAFGIIKNKYPFKPIKLLVVGDGSQKENYLRLSNDLGLNNDIIFTGHIPYKNIVDFHNMCDISVVPSIRESFGVSVLEASACEKPVIITNTGGLPETIIPNKTGLLVEKGNVNELASALEELIFNETLRKKIGINGRKMMQEKYEWNDCVKKMIDIYKNTLYDNATN